MKSDVQVNLRRLGMLMWGDLWGWRYSAILVTSTIVGLMGIVTVVEMVYIPRLLPSTQSAHELSFSVFLFGAGLGWMSMSFKNLGSTSGMIASTMLPASKEEKFLTKWFLSTIGIVASCTLLFKFQNLVSNAATQIIFNYSIPPFNPFTKEILDNIHAFFVAHSIIFLGAIYFKRLAWIKTLFVLLLLTLAIAVFTLLFTRIFLWNDIIYGGFFVDIVNNLDQPGLKAIRTAGKIFFWYLLAPICWAIAYIRFRETEV